MVPVKPSRDIYEVSLDLAPMSNGVLVGTQSNWSEEQIKDNERYIFTPTHEGTIQLGESPNKWGQTHNRAIRLVGYAEGTHELNLLLENVLGMGRSVIEDGIDMEDGTNPQRRPDLKYPYTYMVILWNYGMPTEKDGVTNLKYLVNVRYLDKDYLKNHKYSHVTD